MNAPRENGAADLGLFCFLWAETLGFQVQEPFKRFWSGLQVTTGSPSFYPTLCPLLLPIPRTQDTAHSILIYLLGSTGMNCGKVQG